ncbi:L-serine ammonia-lyase, iron-sulfur-dependent, subunit alpha [Alkalicoccobacillus porphyridii]|uniref:L-serine dehydratase n=1 Tax=Alkalicoccobacillus porphyridii TaxID=2597270 RepID=A0A553ZY47_9BACI|nr:L-serine ammonia-lyase, iron-sulfur-dependent, subunit alpha [Alkalicoccobacillus porphyridii]TSB46371.1 L-serine ammonia-lyase, iron-sulfur-dependent, subunit alpha [Alkalicoccobacillus porphyridii]
MFKNAAELIELADSEGISISEVMIRQEVEETGRSREDVYERMRKNLDVMKAAVDRGTSEDIKSVSGLTGGDAKLLQEYIATGKSLGGDSLLQSVSKAMATNEVNAAMGTICATPTAGASGVVPGVLFGMKEKLAPTDDQMIHFLFTSGAFGFVIANNASISGAAGGCQAEVGSASGMAAAALVELAGGTPEQSGQALAIALKNMLGLVCDPVAGLVEVPCVKRNAMGASIAITAADMALAGIKSRIPCDEVIDAMYRIGLTMPVALKETALGGLAATPTGRRLESEIFGVSLEK